MFRGICVVITPPIVSMPSERRVTSSSSRSDVAGEDARLHLRRANGDDFVRVHAPCADPPNSCFDDLLHLRYANEPPTSTTSSIFDIDAGVESACLVGANRLCSRSSTSCSNLARVSFIGQVLRPD